MLLTLVNIYLIYLNTALVNIYLLKMIPNRVKYTYVFMEFQNEIVQTSQD